MPGFRRTRGKGERGQGLRRGNLWRIGLWNRNHTMRCVALKKRNVGEERLWWL